MRILQLIDSLEAGGAERMAVNYANALSEKVAFSGIVATRQEGPLAKQINDKVSFLFLDKKSSFDLKALFRLKAFVKLNKINAIQAHSTSFFTAFLLKLMYPSIHLIWHDHYGDSEFLYKRLSLTLKVVLPFFGGIISVNQKLKDWAKNQMDFKNTVYLPNFISDEKTTQYGTILKGIEGKRIICLANLRAQKNHFLLLEVAKRLKTSNAEWTFHLVGKDFDDSYSIEIKSFILENNLTKNVFFYGAKQDIKNILNQATIAVLTSRSEGLPLALLEYGLHKKAVVATAVGEIDSVIQNGFNGFTVPSQEVGLFYDALIQLIENKNLRIELGKSLYETVIKKHSEQVVIERYLNWLQSTIFK